MTRLLPLALAVACAAARPDLAGTKRQVAEYVSSGRYEAEIAAIAAEASRHLESRAAGGGKLAIVVDVDETAISNLEMMRLNDYGWLVDGPCDLERGPCPIRAWTELSRGEPIKPVLDLTRLARARGVAVFFLTGRREKDRAATERNLRNAGYEWTRLVLKPDGLTVQSAADFKAPEREKIAAEGYTIVLNIGDQQSDLDGGFAERTFKLPNPFYFTR